MYQLIAIALGGSAGALSRFWVANGIYTVLGRDFPHGTLFINVTGSLLMGFLTELMVHRFAVAVEYRAAVLVGFLGAYTTFSTFALETLTLFEQGSLLKAFLNVLLSVVLCLTACWVGLILGRALFSEQIAPWMTPQPAVATISLGLLALWLSSIMIELFLKYLHAGQAPRALLYIGLLGGFCMTNTLWLGLKDAASALELQQLLGLFIISALGSAAMIWSGSWIGNWIWQLKLSP